MFIPGLVEITLVRARNLLPKDANGLSDPYCLISHWDKNGVRKGKQQKTKVHWETLNPHWDSHFTFVCLDPSERLRIQCWDRDPLSVSDDFEGEVDISFRELTRKCRDGGRPVSVLLDLGPRKNRKTKDIVQGDLELLLRYQSFSPEELIKRGLSSLPVEPASHKQTPELPLPISLRDAVICKLLHLLMHQTNPDGGSGSSSSLHVSLSDSAQVSSRSTDDLLDQLEKMIEEADGDNTDEILRRSSLLTRSYLAGFLKREHSRELLPPQQIVENCLSFCRLVTASSRFFLESYVSKKLPSDYVLYPGKLDHTTLLCFRALPSIVHPQPQAATPFKPFLVSMGRTRGGLPILFVRSLIAGELSCTVLSAYAIQLTVTTTLEPESAPSGSVLDTINECFLSHTEKMACSEVINLPSYFELQSKKVSHITQRSDGMFQISFWEVRSPIPATDSTMHCIEASSLRSRTRVRRPKPSSRKLEAKKQPPTRHTLVNSRSSDCLSKLAE